MTEPKQRLPGTTYFITGVCERHEFRLKPTPHTNAAFAVAMAEAAERYGVEVIAVCAMSSHYHSVVHDRHGYLSEYLRDFHAVMARYGNARDGVINFKFWSSQDSESVVLGDIATVIEKTAYTLANPTKDLIVARPEEWIGVRTAVADLGSGRGPVFVRPNRFFDEHGRVADVVMLGSDLPLEIADTIGIDAFRARVAARVEKYVSEAHAKVRAGEARILGLARAKALSVWHATNRPKARTAGHDAKPRRRVAASSRGRLRAMLEALLQFREQYHAARMQLRRGVSAMFPAGTWLVWRYFGARRVGPLQLLDGRTAAPS